MFASGVVECLLAAKAPLSDRDSKACTPIHLAAWNGHAGICQVLLSLADDRGLSIVNVQVCFSRTGLLVKLSYICL